MPDNRLTRDLEGAMLGGVCSGIAKRWDYDPTLIRLLAILLAVVTAGVGILVYLALWLIMPRAGAESPGAATPGERARDVREDLETAGDRIAASAKVIARSVREAAEEISEIARRKPERPVTAAPPPDQEGSAQEDEPRAAETPPAPETPRPEPPPPPAGSLSAEAEDTQAPSPPWGQPDEAAEAPRPPAPPPAVPEPPRPWESGASSQSRDEGESRPSGEPPPSS